MKLTAEQKELANEVLTIIGGAEGYRKEAKARFVFYFYACDTFPKFRTLWCNSNKKTLLEDLGRCYLRLNKGYSVYVGDKSGGLFTAYDNVSTADEAVLNLEVRYNFFKWLEELTVEQN